MQRQQQTFLGGSTVEGASTNCIIASDGAIQTLKGATGMSVSDSTIPGGPCLDVSLSTEWQQKLNALVASPMRTASTTTVRLPYEQPGDVATVIASGTITMVPLASSTLTLDGTPLNTMSVGYQWYIVNTHPTASIAIVGGANGPTLYGARSILANGVALVRQCGTNMYLVFAVLDIDVPSVLSLLDQSMNVNTVDTTASPSVTDLTVNAPSGTTVRLIATPATIVLNPNDGTVGNEWYVVNGTATSATITLGVRNVTVNGVLTSVQATAIGNANVPSGRVVLVRQYNPAAFLILGTFEDARVAKLMDAVFATTDTSDVIVPQPRLFDSRVAPAGSTTVMNGPSGEVRLYEESTNVGKWWYVVNDTSQDIPLKQTSGSIMTGYLQSIPKGRAAVVKQYATASFNATIAQPTDRTPQTIKGFRVQEYYPGLTTTVIHVPYNPDGTGAELKACSLIHITAPNTVVYVHIGLPYSLYGQPTDRGTYHFLNESNSAVTIMGSESTILNYSQNTMNLDANTKTFLLALTLDHATYWVHTNSIHLPFISANVPVNKTGTKSPNVGTGGILCCSDNQFIQLHPAATISNAINDNGEAGYHIRNVSHTTATLVYSTSTGDVSTTIVPNGFIYMKQVDDTTWIPSTPIIHVPGPTVDDTDPLPNGTILELALPSSLWLYCDFRTIGFEWNIVNSGAADCNVVPLNATTGSAAQTYVSGGTVIPSGCTAILKQTSFSNYVLLVPQPMRARVQITTNGIVLDGTYANKFCNIAITGTEPYTCVLSSAYMVNGAEIDIFNHSSGDVIISSTTSTIVSRDNLRTVPPGSAITAKYMSSIPGFAVVGGLT